MAFQFLFGNGKQFHYRFWSFVCVLSVQAKYMINLDSIMEITLGYNENSAHISVSFLRELKVQGKANYQQSASLNRDGLL